MFMIWDTDEILLQDKYKNMEEIPLMQGEGIWGNVYFDEKFIPITRGMIPDIYDYYLISNYGKVYHKYEGKLVKLYKSIANGNPDHYYYRVTLSTFYGSQTFMLHRLVMVCFYPELGLIDNPMDINHKDGNRINNYISYNDPSRGNIEWLSHRDNMMHAYKTGLHHIGEDNVHSKISNETAMKIIELLDTNKYTSKEIVEIVGNGATIHMVDDIRKKQCWNHLSEGHEFYQRPHRLFVEDDIHHFCKFFQDHYPNPYKTKNDLCRAALEAYGFEPSYENVETVRKLYAKKYYKDIVSQYIF